MIQQNLNSLSKVSRFGTYSNYLAVWSTRGSNTGEGKRFFSSLKRPDWLWGPSILLFNWYRGSLTRVYKYKYINIYIYIWPGHETGHSPALTAAVKNEWIYISTPLIYLRVVHRDSFNFFLLYCKISFVKNVKMLWDVTAILFELLSPSEKQR